MKIKELYHIEITLTVCDKPLYNINEGDLIMYRGDTYKVIGTEINPVIMEQVIVLELYKRAINIYAIDIKNNLLRVADYDLNCKRGK